jgi:hypothetical protein
MKPGLSYEKGHIVVAAIRVLEHRQERAPTAEEITELTGLPGELTGVILNGLEEMEVLRSIESPYDMRYEIVDHLRLEELPREEDSPKLRDEVDSFHERARSRQEEMDKMFGDPDREKKRKKKLSKLEEELKRFKKSGRPPHPFAEDDY